jgi:acyl-CoA thioesterase FadM
MKNLMTEIKKCEQTKYVQTYTVTKDDCNARGHLNQWVLFNLVEKLQEEPAQCLAKIAPQYKKDLNEVNMRLYDEAKLGDKLEFEARFYEVDKRQVELKIFVRKVSKDKTSKRVCRAGYTFKAVYDNQLA